jgi:hypothetical protein
MMLIELTDKIHNKRLQVDFLKVSVLKDSLSGTLIYFQGDSQTYFSVVETQKEILEKFMALQSEVQRAQQRQMMQMQGAIPAGLKLH